jgi:uncharacterized protein YdhG (YjbR/CyaY superfamily)
VTAPTAIDDYLARFDGERRATLDRLHATLRTLLPTAQETLKYRMPAFVVHGGKTVAGFDGFSDHCSYFPHSGSVIDRAGPLPAWADAGAGTLRFPIGRTLPTPLLRRLIRVRLDEISAVADGARIDYFPDGRVKAEGRMKAGRLHGAWKWYRHDGSLMRAGHFLHGEQSGRWETFDRGGRLVTAKRL